MDNINEIEHYFYSETEGLEISEIVLEDTKHSYFDTVLCYRVLTTQGLTFYVFSGDSTLTNLYPLREGETLDECYYRHIGFMAEYASRVLESNFLVHFLKDTSVFPILKRRMAEIEKDIDLERNSNQLSGLANQIRDCYLILTDYLMNKNRTHNSAFKNDNFKDNLKEFISYILPGNNSERRRNVVNTIAQKGWDLNSELIHKDSVTVFDILISYNILQLVVSTISNIVVGNNMPFNKIKCPSCKGERHVLKSTLSNSSFIYICQDCGYEFEVSMDELIKDL